MIGQKKYSLFLSQKEICLGIAYLLVSRFLLPYVIAIAASLIGLHDASSLNLAYNAANVIFCIWVFRKLLMQSITQVKYRFKKTFQTALYAALFILICISVVNVAIYSIWPEFNNGNNSSIIQMAVSSPWSILCQTVILAPIAEECIFRGLLFTAFYHKNPIYGYVCSATVFSFVHLVGFLGSAEPLSLLLSFIQYLPSGFILAWVLAHTNTLIGPMLTHSFINAFSLFSIFVQMQTS